MAKSNVENMENVNVQEQDVPFTGGNTETERMGRPLQGLLIASGIKLVQKKKNPIGETKADGSQDYFYNLSFSNGEDIFSCTAGKTADDMRLLADYDVGFNYLDKKLKLVDYIKASI